MTLGIAGACVLGALYGLLWEHRRAGALKVECERLEWQLTRTAGLLAHEREGELYRPRRTA